MASETNEKVWRLTKGDLALGAIIVTDYDFPWIYGTIQRTEYFDLDRDAMLRLENGDESDLEAIDAL